MDSDVARLEGLTGEGCGMFVVTARALSKDELVLREKPLMLSPKQSSPLVCMECCCLLDNLDIVCQKCGLPLCASCSSQNIFQNHNLECTILMANNIKFNFNTPEEVKKIYLCISPLRLLLTGRREEWSCLESHAPRRKDTAIWHFNNKHVIPLLTKLRGPGNKKWSEEEVHEAAGILDTNAFEANNDEKSRCRGIYAEAARFNNSCQPNCTRKFVDGEIFITTIRPVCNGEELTLCYTGVLSPNHIRQAIFLQTKHFQCGCARCRDPTEMETFPTSLKCTSCGDILLPGEAGMECRGCYQLVDAQKAQFLERMSENLVGNVNCNDCDSLLNSLRKIRNILSSNHHLLVKLKKKFIAHSENCIGCKKEEEYNKCSKEIQDLLIMLQLQFV